MKNLARLSSLVAALCVGIPATGFTKDHGGSSQSGNVQGNHGSFQGNHGSFQGNHGSFQGTHGNWQASNHSNWHGGDHGNWHGGHGDWHGHNHFYGPSFGFYGSYYPYYSTPYYGGDYYDDYDSGPSVGFSITDSSSYRSGGDDLAIGVQRALRRDGYYRGSVDGDVGPGTRGAIRQYQYDHGLEVTGRIDRGLLRSLGLD